MRMQPGTILIEKVVHHGEFKVPIAEVLQVARRLSVCRTIDRPGQNTHTALFRDGE